MAEILVVPAFARQLTVSVTIFGKRLPGVFAHPGLFRLIRLLGGTAVYELDDMTKRYLETVAAMYERMCVQSCSRTLGLFEPLAIFLGGRGSVKRGILTVELMTEYLQRLSVPKELVFAEVSSRSLQRNLHRFADSIREYSLEEGMLKLIFVAEKGTANLMNRRLRCIVPMALFGRTGFLRKTGVRVFFLSHYVSNPRDKTFFEKLCSSPRLAPAVYLCARLFPSMKGWSFRMIEQTSPSHTEDDEAVSIFG